MLTILKIFKILKIFGFLLFVCFFMACENKPGQVTPGEAQTTKIVASGSCPDGSSFTVSKTVVGAVSSELQIGDKVTIKGTINNGYPCRQGSVSFTCTAVYSIPNNRSFICEQGSLYSALSTTPSYSTNPTVPYSQGTSAYSYTPSTGIPTASSNTIVSGQFQIFGNGTKSSGRIVIPSSFPLVPPCIMSFNCL